MIEGFPLNWLQCTNCVINSVYMWFEQFFIQYFIIPCFPQPPQVADIAFAPDSRWVAISTRHGTTHVFPLTPYGGAITARTHGQSRVVNRTSRFLQSAGVDERTTVAQSGRESPAARVQGGPITTGPTTGPGMFWLRALCMRRLNASWKLFVHNILRFKLIRI